jgi:hypothetical protein
MNDLCFGPPPRAAGWAGIRRLLMAGAWLVACGTPGALLATASAGLWRERSESIRLAESGVRTTSTVVHRHRVGSSYTLNLVRDDGHGSFQVRVGRSEWRSHPPGTKSPFYYDPRRPGRGVAEVQRADREALGPILWCGGIGAFLCVLALGRAWGLLGQFLLLREGIELVAVNAGPELRVSHADRVASVRRPLRVDRLIRTRAAPGGYVALATEDLSRILFPDLRDVPSGRLAREEEIRCILPAPPRVLTAGWKEWLRVRHAGLRGVTVGLSIGGLVLGAVVAGFMGWGSGGLAGGAIAASLPLLIGILSGLAWARGHWRDRVLWRVGVEVHAVLIESAPRRGKARVILAYRLGGQEFRVAERYPEEPGPLEAAAPPGDPIAAPRLVVLVDPRRPERWTVVPEGIGYNTSGE